MILFQRFQKSLQNIGAFFLKLFARFSRSKQKPKPSPYKGSYERHCERYQHLGQEEAHRLYLIMYGETVPNAELYFQPNVQGHKPASKEGSCGQNSPDNQSQPLRNSDLEAGSVKRLVGQLRSTEEAVVVASHTVAELTRLNNDWSKLKEEEKRQIVDSCMMNLRLLLPEQYRNKLKPVKRHTDL